ncbi:MAG: chemotaxis protein [Burkholderiales bacterium PBB4]|nr:MAG: chemotaxis protein [Burkholderiales bacterium PBB4]
MHKTTTQYASAMDAHGLWTPGVVLMRNLGFKAKALVVSVAMLVPMLALVAWLMWNHTDAAMGDRMRSTRQHVEIAHGIVVWAHGRQTSGELSEELAQRLAKDAISKLRYEGSEYFWINDMAPKVVMHPIKPELDGKDVGDVKDPNGFALFKAFADMARTQKAGFVYYQWPKPGFDKPVDKVSYVKGFEPWGWVVGSGIYIDDLRADQTSRLWRAGMVVGLVLLIAGYVFWAFYRVNQGGLDIVSGHLNDLTAGDLRQAPQAPWGADEPAALIVGLGKVYDSFRELIRRVRHGARELAVTSAEVSRASLDLSARTEDAASNLGEQAAAVEQIGAQVAETARRTQDAAAVADQNSLVAERGGRIIAEVVTTMQDIHTSSARINDIIGTIDGIAFQTNILALNAAVEAARAGESGRGFAVVASEVRSLAQRSAEAAREIKTLISDSVEKVAAGTQVVEGAGATMSEMVTNAKKINQFLSEISNAAVEQATGVKEVVNAIHQLDAHTQQNAALVEQTSAAARALSDQADKLTEEIARFRVS